MSNNKIKLTYLNGTGFIFNAKDYLLLRKKYRIVGCTTILSTVLPIELTQWETQLLLEENIAIFLSKTESLVKAPTSEEQVEYRKKLEERIAKQFQVLKIEKLHEAERNMDIILKGKREKLLKKGLTEIDINLNACDILKEISDKYSFDQKNALIEIPYQHIEKHTANIINMPTDNSLKYKVFRDLWKRGKYVTAGDSFGADFLLYPGDPMLYHASHIVVLLDSPSIQPLQLIGKVRLANSVNKNCVFAFFNESNETETRSQEISYQTVRWEPQTRNDKNNKNE